MLSGLNVCPCNDLEKKGVVEESLSSAQHAAHFMHTTTQK